MHLIKRKDTATEEEVLAVEKELENTKKLIENLMKTSINDILIMLNLFSSKCLLITRRLISAERDLYIAIKIFRKSKYNKQEYRPDFPIIPRYILRQRIILQKALVMIDFKRKQEAALLLTKLLKVGKYYDPLTRMEDLQTLQLLFSFHPQGSLIEKYPETESINQMLQLFQTSKKKNVILLVDSIEDQYFKTKKNICCEIFDCLDSKDNVSLISMAKKINRVFSLVPKSQNTVQLYNQLKYLEPSDNKNLLFLNGICDCVDEIFNYGLESRNNYYNWII